MVNKKEGEILLSTRLNLHGLIFFGMDNLQLGHAIHFHNFISPLQNCKDVVIIIKICNPTMCCMNPEKMSATHRCISTKNLSGEQ